MTAKPLEGFYFHDFANSYIPNILTEIYVHKIYQPYLVGKRNLTILDVGQNIGLTSFYFKEFGTVIGLEPAKVHREACEAMIKQGGYENVKVLPYALSNENGTMKLFHNQNSTMHSLEKTVNNPNDFEEVKTITFDKLMEELKLEKIDFVKLDTEGHESAILTSDGFSKVADKIHTLVFEWHTWTSSSLSNLEHRMQDLGFTTQRLKTDATVVACVRV